MLFSWDLTVKLTRGFRVYRPLKSLPTVASESDSIISRLSESCIERASGFSLNRPASRKSCTWCEMVGFETLRISDNSAAVRGDCAMCETKTCHEHGLPIFVNYVYHSSQVEQKKPRIGTHGLEFRSKKPGG